MCNKTCGAAHNAQEAIMQIFRTTQLAATQQHKCVIRSCKYTVQTLVEKHKIKCLSLKAACIFGLLGAEGTTSRQTHCANKLSAYKVFIQPGVVFLST